MTRLAMTTITRNPGCAILTMVLFLCFHVQYPNPVAVTKTIANSVNPMMERFPR